MLVKVSRTTELLEMSISAWISRLLRLSQSYRPFFGVLTCVYLAVFVLAGYQPALSQESTKTSTSSTEAAEKATDKAKDSQPAAAKAESADKQKWKSLLPKTGLEGWAITDFSGKGEVKNENGELIIETGEPLAGIHYKKADFPKDSYEIELEAQRIEGNDFLCGLTFPVAEEFCSLIAGGWGGGVVGLSSVDGYDASENATSNYQTFENRKWYKFRLRVDPEWITAWINDKEVIKQERAGHEFSTRIEVYASRPLGFCAFDSKVGVRNFRWRPIEADEK